MTINTYSHLMPDMQQTAIDALEVLKYELEKMLESALLLKVLLYRKSKQRKKDRFDEFCKQLIITCSIQNGELTKV